MANEIEPGIWHKPNKKPRIRENTITGNFWKIEKQENKCLFHYDAGSHGGKITTFEVPISTFEDLKSGSLTAKEVIDKYFND